MNTTEEIKSLITQADKASIGVDAMQFSQAALNAANALAVLASIKSIK